MKILITNDDGFKAAGLAALVRAAKLFGRPVVVSPAHPHSMKSHAITTGQPISIEKRHDPQLGHCYICDATPADCVRLALAHLPIGTIDMVFSGINHGGNAGVDVFYSGTVAAAREATFHGISAIAISQLMRPQRSDNWQAAGDHAVTALREVLSSPAMRHPPRLININLPDLPSGHAPKGVKWCPLTAEPLATSFETLTADMQDQHRARYTGQYFERPAPPGFDFQYLLDEWVTVTPLRSDPTDHTALCGK